MPLADIAIVTVIPDEYQAVLQELAQHGCRPVHDPGSSQQPNQYGWVAGPLTDETRRVYQVVVAFACLPGHTQMTDAVGATVRRYSPRHVVLTGIAGGFPLDGLAHGDVVLSSVIYNYEYGKVAAEFRPRHDFTHQVDGGLLSGGTAFDVRDRRWATADLPPRPGRRPGCPKLCVGAVASGNKVVDDAGNAFFAKVLASWPKLLAVEMEGAGAAAAIQAAQSRGARVGFVMVRGISDMPRAEGDPEPALPEDGNRAERDAWKTFAAVAAARFTVRWIVSGWPVPPRPTRGGRGAYDRPGGSPPPPSGVPAAAGRRPPPAGLPTDSADTSVRPGFEPRTLPPADQMPRPSRGESAVSDRLRVELKDRFRRASVDLLRWPTTVAGGHWLDRPELAELIDRLSTQPCSTSVVLGPPGCGKSALLARLGTHLADRGTTVLAVKADLLRGSVDSAARLSDHLGLTGPTDLAITAVAAEPVVLLIDQLDALADLSDLRSERLHVLLDLVRRVGGRPNVHVVCSCREFEYAHDGRLGRLDAAEVRLGLPGWEPVRAVLSARGVDAAGWPPAARDLLRVPYHLSLFLRHLDGTGEHRVFTSYQQLFNELWDERVVRPGGGRADLLYDLAAELAEAEELWVDREWFSGRRDLVDPLVAADVLSRTGDGFRVGFRHQSLFEFVRAKAFARDGASLAGYVLARQDALFVRPTLWMTLNYLRLANPSLYAREFDRLWTHPGLRRHVKHLLVDFLAHLEEPPPDDREQARLVTALRDGAWRRKVLAAVAGRAGWFDRLAGPYLSAEMRRAPEEAWDVVAVLVGVLGARRDHCLRLMEAHWLPADATLPHVWQTLSHLAGWDDRAAALAAAVVRRTEVGRDVMWRLAQAIAKGHPGLAVGLVGAWLDAEVRRVRSATPADHPDRERRLGKLFGNTNHWYGVGAIAERAPEAFVLGLWPRVVDVLECLRGVPSRSAIRYADDRLWVMGLDSEEDPEPDGGDHFLRAFDAALGSFARLRSEAFCALLRDAGNPDSRLLQRLMCRGLREAVAARPDDALAYVLSDPRRFWLGGMHDDLGDSRALVAALGEHLGDGPFAGLVSAIRGWVMYRAPENGGDVPSPASDEYARARRYRLLSALPTERLDEPVRMELAAESTALPPALVDPGPPPDFGFHEIVSPVPLAKMEAMEDGDVAALFDALPDSTEDRHPDDWNLGGSVQLAREFEAFARSHPSRAIHVLARLRPGDHQERPAAHGIRGLVAAGHAAEVVVRLATDLDARGFAGQEFRELVAYALADVARPGGLSDAGLKLLERWRIREWDTAVAVTDDPADASDPGRPSSVLWGTGGRMSFPPGRFAVLYALTIGLLRRSPPASDRWLATLVDHLDRDRNDADWRTMCLYLSEVVHCSDRTAAGGFLTRLLESVPGVLSSQAGARLLAVVAPLLADEARRRAYDAVREWGGAVGTQAFGELIAHRHLTHPDDAWAAGQVEAAFGNTAGSGDRRLLGVTFAAAHLWTTPASRTRATDLLCRLIPAADEATAVAVIRVFRTPDELPLDEPALAVLRRIAEHPDVLVRGAVNELFFDHLLDAMAADPELVWRIAAEAVRRRGDELRSVRYEFFMAGSALIDISLRLQRGGGEHRARGLDLFEALLDLGVAEAVAVTRSTDHRLVAGTRLPRRARGSVSTGF